MPRTHAPQGKAGRADARPSVYTNLHKNPSLPSNLIGSPKRRNCWDILPRNHQASSLARHRSCFRNLTVADVTSTLTEQPAWADPLSRPAECRWRTSRIRASCSRMVEHGPPNSASSGVRLDLDHASPVGGDITRARRPGCVLVGRSPAVLTGQLLECDRHEPRVIEQHDLVSGSDTHERAHLRYRPPAPGARPHHAKSEACVKTVHARAVPGPPTARTASVHRERPKVPRPLIKLCRREHYTCASRCPFSAIRSQVLEIATGRS